MTFEVNFIEQFSPYELQAYAESRYWANRTIFERDEVIEGLYEDISPTIVGVNYEEGRMYYTSTPVEDMAILIIERKEEYDRIIKRYTMKAEAFDRAMDTLSDREVQVVQVYYFGRENDLGLSGVYFSEVLAEAQEKLCRFLSEARIKHIKAFNEQNKIELKRRIQAS